MNSEAVKRLIREGAKLDGLIVEAQRLITASLVPDGKSQDSTMNRLIALFDGPYQREVQNGWREATILAALEREQQDALVTPTPVCIRCNSRYDADDRCANPKCRHCRHCGYQRCECSLRAPESDPGFGYIGQNRVSRELRQRIAALEAELTTALSRYDSAALEAQRVEKRNVSEIERLRTELTALRSAGTFADGVEAAAEYVDDTCTCHDDPCRLVVGIRALKPPAATER